MFKNPLKYQQGGQLNQKQQQMLAAFIDWLPKRIKEFEGMQPDAIVQALEGMSKTPEGQKQVQAYMQQFQNEMNGITSNKLGGKIQDFICKHAKGGHVAGCGCAQKGAEGMVIDEPEGYTWGQYNKNDFLNSGEDHTGWTQVRTPDGRTGWARNYRRRFLGIPSKNLDQILVTPDPEDRKMRSVGRSLDNFFGKGQIDTVYIPRNPGDDTPAWRSIVNSSLEGVAPERKQEGGEVEKGQNGMRAGVNVQKVIDYYKSQNKYKTETFPNGSISEDAYPISRTITPQGDTLVSVTGKTSPVILSPYSKIGKEYGPGSMDFTGNRTVANPETWKMFNNYVDALKGKRIVQVPNLDKPQMTVKFRIK